MFSKMVAIATTVLTALAVVGVAWAATDEGAPTSVTSADAVTSTSSDTATSVTSGTSESSSPTTAGDETSTSQATVTTIDDSTSATLGEDSTTSTTSGATTSTSAGASTSTSFDDSDLAPPDGIGTYAISGVGTVTIEVRNGSLILVGVSAPGWRHEVEKADSDRIEIEFENGRAEAEFDARIHHGGIDVRSKVDSD